MCYSAMVKQGVQSGLRWRVRLQTDRVEELFRRRTRGDTIKIAKAFEANFYNPQAPVEENIKRFIDEYRRRKAPEWEAEMFKQRKRLVDAERKLKARETKKALEDRRIANDAVAALLQPIADLSRSTLPQQHSTKELQALLDDRGRFHYARELAA